MFSGGCTVCLKLISSLLKPSHYLSNSAHAALDFTTVSADHYLKTLWDSQIKEAWQSVQMERAMSIALQMGH